MPDTRENILRAVQATTSLQELNSVKSAYLGKQGSITLKMRDLSKLENKQEVAADLNSMKTLLFEEYEKQKNLIEERECQARLRSEAIDVSLPARQMHFGRIHPLSTSIAELTTIFGNMGFQLLDGPDLENEYYNFTALNVEEHHPARQMQDSFYLAREYNGASLLRTHTSNTQIRYITNHQPPLRFISIGRVYRVEYDQTHTPMFHQIEAVMIDKNINMGNLKYIIHKFLCQFFNQSDIEIRLRPSYFPFTEPSAEVDMKGSNGRWLELMGCGMIHPKVLQGCGVSAQEYTGLAFGAGIERLTMIKYGINDARHFFQGDGRWLNMYGSSI